MANPPNITVILLTGAWHQPVHYDKLIEGLRAKGFKVVCHNHPSNLGTKGLKDDVAFVQYLVQKELDQGRIVDVLTHSYGGVVAAGAFGGMGLKTRANAGKSGGIRYFMGMATFLPPQGKSLATMLGPQGLPEWIVPRDDGTCFPDGPEKVFYHDLTDIDREWAVKLLLPQCTEAQTVPVETVTWSEFEKVHYLKCLNDQALPPFVQDIIIDGFKQTTGGHIEVTEVFTSHSPMYFDGSLKWASRIIGSKTSFYEG